MGLFGPPNVEKLKAKRDVKGLIKALGYKKARQVRGAAAWALGQLGDARAVEPLIAALKDSYGGVRGAAVVVLAQIGDARAVEPLIAALKDDWPGVRQAAAEALGQIGNNQAMEPLVVTLKDSNKNVRQAAAGALGHMGDARAMDPLLTTLQDSESVVREAGAGALGQLGDARAVEPLVAALNDRDGPVRRGAAEALGRIGAPAVGPLIAALKDSSVRQAAVGVLGQLGDARAVEPLLPALQDGDKNVRQVVMRALDKLGWQPDQTQAGAAYWIAKSQWNKCVAIGAPAVEPLIAALKDSDGPVRHSAADALGQLGDACAVEPLIAALKDDWPRVRQAAAEALDKLGWRPNQNQVGAAYWIVKSQWDQCVTIGAPAVEPLIAALKDSEWQVRQAAAGALGQIADARAVEPLLAALKASDKEVRKAVAGALGQLGDARAVEPLLAALKEGNEAAVGALVQIGDARAVEPLIVMLNEVWSMRQVAARTLGQLGDARAVEPLIAVLKDSNKDMRYAAAGALVRLYQTGQLDGALKQCILTQRNTIIREHSDSHQDWYQGLPGCFGEHDDSHDDSGIGVDFPL